MKSSKLIKNEKSRAAAAACTLILLRKNRRGELERTLLFAQGLYLGEGVCSTSAEIAALRSLFSVLRQLTASSGLLARMKALTENVIPLLET